MHDEEAEVVCGCVWDWEWDSEAECLDEYQEWPLSEFYLLDFLDFMWYEDEGYYRTCIETMYERHRAEIDEVLVCGMPIYQEFLDCLTDASCDEMALEECQMVIWDDSSRLEGCREMAEPVLEAIDEEIEATPGCLD